MVVRVTGMINEYSGDTEWAKERWLCRRVTFCRRRVNGKTAKMGLF